MLKDIKHPHLKKEKVNFVFAMRRAHICSKLLKISFSKCYNIPLFWVSYRPSDILWQGRFHRAKQGYTFTMVVKEIRAWKLFVLLLATEPMVQSIDRMHVGKYVEQNLACSDTFIAHTVHFNSFLSILFINFSACVKSEIFETVGT